MLLGDGNDSDFPVQATVKSEVCFLRIDRIVIRVIDRDRKGVLFRPLPGQFHPEGGIASFMMGDKLSVKVNLSCHGCAVDLKENGFPGQFLGS